MEGGGEVAGNAFASASGVVSSEGSSEGSLTCTVDSEVEKPALSITPPELDSCFIMPPNEARSERGSAFDNVMPKSIFGGVGDSAIAVE